VAVELSEQERAGLREQIRLDTEALERQKQAVVVAEAAIVSLRKHRLECMKKLRQQ
jgi:hypothetical protein